MLRNWKTTLTGWAFAATNLTVNGLTLKQFLVSAAIAALGTLAKDHDVSGGPR